MSNLAKSLFSSFLGALQASLSILLTLSYGIIANRIGLYGKSTSDDISKLCANLFLPALIFTNVGSELELSRWNEYVPVLVWALVYCLLSYLLGVALVKLFKLPKWVIPAICFNNTTSLPLLMTQALESTGVLNIILPKGMDLSSAVSRAKSYYLVNSMISNTLTFAFGPRLLSSPGDAEDDEEEQDQNQDMDEEEAEQQPLLPQPITDRAAAAKNRVDDYMNGIHANLPAPLQKTTSLLKDVCNPTLLGSFLAMFVGLIPALHKVFFADMQESGYFKAWLTASIKNIGELFTVLQMFVAGYQLSSSFNSKEELKFPYLAFGIVFAVRFILWPLIAIPAVYGFSMAQKFLAASHSINEADPYSILWFAMMLMPIGPPAIAVTCVFGLVASGPEGRKENQRISRVIAVMYAITPVISFAVVAALKATELIGKRRATA